MKKALFLTLLFATFAFCANVFSQNYLGTWKTVDDETGEAKSYVKIYKATNGKYYGKITKLLKEKEDAKCDKCTDYRKDKPVVGMNIITDMQVDGNGLSGGTIMDPANGKIYKCKMKVVDGKLEVRGFIGFSLIGRTQTWYTVKE